MIRLLACIVGLCAVVSAARAETIRVVIPYAPGGALDPLARMLVNGLGKLRPGDSIIVENIGGAGGIVGMNTCRQGGAGWTHAAVQSVGKYRYQPLAPIES